MTIYVFEVRFYMSCLKHTRSERTNVKCKNDEAVFLSIVCESFSLVLYSYKRINYTILFAVLLNKLKESILENIKVFSLLLSIRIS